MTDHADTIRRTESREAEIYAAIRLRKMREASILRQRALYEKAAKR